jgi:hypothetical protein
MVSVAVVNLQVADVGKKCIHPWVNLFVYPSIRKGCNSIGLRGPLAPHHDLQSIPLSGKKLKQSIFLGLV